MLVLSRKPTEDIVFVGLNIRVRVLEIRGNQVRIGIDAPRDVKIARAELLCGKDRTPDDETAASKH
jgi:carbon storage regulator